jgi:hypothetical protein
VVVVVLRSRFFAWCLGNGPFRGQAMVLVFRRRPSSSISECGRESPIFDLSPKKPVPKKSRERLEDAPGLLLWPAAAEEIRRDALPT